VTGRMWSGARRASRILCNYYQADAGFFGGICPSGRVGSIAYLSNRPLLQYGYLRSRVFSELLTTRGPRRPLRSYCGTLVKSFREYVSVSQVPFPAAHCPGAA
jgi:hypothetical protein